MVRENLALAIAYWIATRKEQITPAHLPRERDVVTNEAGHVVEVFNPLTIRRQVELARCSLNQVRSAFAFSAIQSHRTMQSVCSGPPLSEPDPGLRAARSFIYLLDRAFGGSMMAPVWSCPLEYRRRFEIAPISLVIDAARLDGQRMSWDDFGGLDKYLEFLEYCAAAVEGRPRLAEEPEDADDDFSDEEDDLDSNGGDAASTDDDSVGRFVAERCVVGSEERIIASGLYAEYQEWCEENQQQPMAQRSFGMRLTGMGFTRRRRGRGRHWWEGLDVEGQEN